MITNQDKSVLEFPVKVRDWDVPMTDLELVSQARLFGAKALNQLATGQIDELPEDIKQSILWVNEMCSKVGLSPLEVHF